MRDIIDDIEDIHKDNLQALLKEELTISKLIKEYPDLLEILFEKFVEQIEIIDNINKRIINLYQNTVKNYQVKQRWEVEIKFFASCIYIDNEKAYKNYTRTKNLLYQYINALSCSRTNKKSNLIDITEVKNKSLTLVIESFGFQIKKAGVHGYFKCPFHADKNPSLCINEDKGYFYCFGCGENSDNIAFVEKHLDYSFPEACKYILSL